MTRERFANLSSAFQKLRIAVVGDFCLDRYLEIDPERGEVSIETGLPVHNVVRVRAQPGAAGTIVNNLEALGVGQIFPVGFCGDDGEGYELLRALRAQTGVDLGHFVQTPERRTFTYCKPLVLVPGEPPRELNRLDSKNWDATPEPVSAQFAASIKSLAQSLDAIIVMEQTEIEGTGVVTMAVLKALGEIARDLPELPIVADSRRSLAGYPPCIFKMNAAELAAMAGGKELAADQIAETASRLARTNGRPVIITMAEKGLLGASPSAGIVHVPALPVRGPIDIVGAGDSVTASVTTALAADAPLDEALELAALASSIVVHQLGTSGSASIGAIAALLGS
ncbi:MAG: bifunctional heptose 7-phosphate kinase/heptose 1-phosphate adenyltransferase [Chthoniobacteraceae bacterium]